MKSSGPIYSSSVRPQNYGSTPSYSRSYNIGGSSYTAYGYGFMSGYSLGWLHPSWYYYTPFSPYFYYSPPSYYNGAYYSGGFSFMKLLLAIIIFAVIIWIVLKLIKGKGVRYTTYR